MSIKDKKMITDAYIDLNFYKIGFIDGTKWFNRDTHKQVNIEAVKKEKLEIL